MNMPGSLWSGLAGAALLLAAAPVCLAAPIYSCEVNGKRVTSDRPIPECNDRPQRVLNTDGSVQKVLPPTPTADERTAAEERDRDVQRERMMKQDAIRRDRNLLARFPNEAAHRKAREASLEDSRQSLKRSEQRIALLAKERKPLLDDAEFYVGKQLPARLKQQLDANEAAVQAQKDLIASGEAEIARINALYDAELDRLRALWSGVQPGSMGLLPVQPAASGPRRAQVPVSRASASEAR